MERRRAIGTDAERPPHKGLVTLTTPPEAHPRYLAVFQVGLLGHGFQSRSVTFNHRTPGASKAATEALTGSAAIELGLFGITVNTIAPGPIQTSSMTPQSEDKLIPVIPLGRIGEPHDIAGAVIFLASEQSRWLTGQVIKISGGHEI